MASKLRTGGVDGIDPILPPKTPILAGKRCPYVGDDSVTIILANKVLDLARRSILQSVAADEVVCNLELLCIRRLAIDIGHRPPIGTLLGTS